MKKLLALILAMVMVLSLAACGGEEEYEEYEEEEYEEEVDEVETEAAAEEDAEMNAPVSDEHFADLQETYAQLADLYNQVIDLYNNDQVAADEDINTALSETKEIMDTMGEIDRSELDEQGALDLMETMGYLAETLGLVIDNMEAA